MYSRIFAASFLSIMLMGSAFAAAPQPVDNTVFFNLQLVDTVRGCTETSIGTANATTTTQSGIADANAQSQASADVVIVVNAALGIDVRRHGNGGSVNEVSLAGNLEDALVTISDARGNVATAAVTPSGSVLSDTGVDVNAGVATAGGTTVGLYTKGANIEEVTGRISTASLTFAQVAVQATEAAIAVDGTGAMAVAGGSVQTIASALADIRLQADIGFQRGKGKANDVIVLDNVTAIIGCNTGTAISAIAQSAVQAKLP